MRQAQDHYLIKHAAALASKRRQASGETPALTKAWWQHSAPSFGELVGAAKGRAYFAPYTRRLLSPEQRYAFYQKNQDRLAVPASHRFVGVSVNARGYRRALKQPAEHAARDLRALRAAALEDPKGFYAKAEAFFAAPAFAADRWGRAHKHFEWVASDEALSADFWQTNLRGYPLSDEQLAALRSLKLGEVSEIIEHNGAEIFLVYSGYEPPKTGWANLRHADALNQALWDQEAREQVRAERDRVLELGAPLAASAYPQRGAAYKLVRWDAIDPKSGAFHALRWKPVTPVADGKVAASYWVEVATPQGDQPPVFTVYGRAQLPGDEGVLVYALRSDAPKDAKPQAISVDPKP